MPEFIQLDEVAECGLSGADQKRIAGCRIMETPTRECQPNFSSQRFGGSCFVPDGIGCLRVDGKSYTLNKYDGLHVWPDPLRQVFNDTGDQALWLFPEHRSVSIQLEKYMMPEILSRQRDRTADRNIRLPMASGNE